jgi:hypothetical protein
MQINLKHMDAKNCWNFIIAMHNDYHNNLKKFGYEYSAFVPNDKRIHEFMEIEKPTPEQTKHYRNIFVNEIYNYDDLTKFDTEIINEIIPKMQTVIANKIIPLAGALKANIPEQLNIVCAYGDGGTYAHGKTPVILFRCSEHSGNGIFSMFIHEFVHLLIEEPIIIKYGVPQDMKERIVDLICAETIKRSVQEWCKDSFANAYITPEVIKTDLESAVKKMMADYTAIKQTQNNLER